MSYFADLIHVLKMVIIWVPIIIITELIILGILNVFVIAWRAAWRGRI